MATYTPNYNMRLPGLDDDALIDDINGNMGIIDTEMRATRDNVAIVVNGNTAPRAITAGQYLFIKNHSSLSAGGYHATANIANGGAVTSSNVAADAAGIVNGAFDVINSKINHLGKGIRVHTGGCAVATLGSEIRFFVPLTNYDGYSSITIHSLGVTNIWGASEGASHASVLSNYNGGVAIRATADAGTFTVGSAYYFDVDLSISE